jgi:hypothetical protein
VQPDQPRQAVLPAPYWERFEVGAVGDGLGGDGNGQGVAADELQQHRAGFGGADPAQQGAEPVGQVVGPVGEVGRALPGDQPDVDPVDVPGRRHFAEDGQDDPGLVGGGQVGDGHHGGPLAPVGPGPPLAPGRASYPPGEPGRPVVPPHQQDHSGPHEHGGHADPRDGDPQEDQHGQGQGGGGVAEDQADDPDDEPGQPGDEDESGRGLVDRGTEDGPGERVGVVDLGDLFPGDHAAHKMLPSSMVVPGENPGAAGGTSSSRPALISRSITPPARKVHPDQPPQSGQRACPARRRTGSPPRPAGGRRPRHQR